MRHVRVVIAVAIVTAALVGSVGTAGADPARLRLTKPGAPQDLVVTPANTALSVSWGTPKSDGGTPITEYTVTASRSKETTETCSTTGATSCVVSGLVNSAGRVKETYTVKVTATNTVGTGKAATGHAAPSSAQNCSYQGAYANLQDCTLAGADLSNADLAGANLSNANLSGDDFAGADLTNTDFDGADLDPCAPGTPTNFTGDTLTGTQFVGVNLSCAILTDTVFDGVDFSGANFAGIVSGGITTTANGYTLPNSNWVIIPPFENGAGYLCGPGANLSGARFVGANFVNMDLSGADFSGDQFNSSGFNGSDLSEANFTNVTFGQTDLSDANLSGTIFTGAQLSGFPSGGGFAFREITGGDTGTPAALPPGWQVVQGYDGAGEYLVGPGAELQQAQLQGVNLAGADLDGANFLLANLSGTALAGANLTDVISCTNNYDPTVYAVTGTPASLPDNWQVVNGCLVGPGAYLEDAPLVQANLTGTDLTDADLTDATLNDAILTDTTLTGTNFTGADMDFVSSGGIVGTPAALPVNWTIPSGFAYLVGPKGRSVQGRPRRCRLPRRRPQRCRAERCPVGGSDLLGRQSHRHQLLRRGPRECLARIGGAAPTEPRRAPRCRPLQCEPRPCRLDGRRSERRRSDPGHHGVRHGVRHRPVRRDLV